MYTFQFHFIYLGSISFLFHSFFFFLKKFTYYILYMPWKKRTTLRRNFHSFVYIYMKKM